MTFRSEKNQVKVKRPGRISGLFLLSGAEYAPDFCCALNKSPCKSRIALSKYKFRGTGAHKMPRRYIIQNYGT